MYTDEDIENYVKVVYQSEPIGKERIILELTTFDIESYKRYKEIRTTKETKEFDFKLDTPLNVIQEQLNEFVKRYYGYELEKFRRFEEDKKINTIKNVTNSEDIYCDVIQGNVINCDNVHCKEIKGNVINSEVYK